MTITTDQLTQFRALLKNEEKSAATLNKYLPRHPALRPVVGRHAAGARRHAGLQGRPYAPLRRRQRQFHPGRAEPLSPYDRPRGLPRSPPADPVPGVQPRGTRDHRPGVCRSGPYRPETGRARLALVLQTICATGIRVSELPAITAEAARRGVAVVRCKGKSRRVLIPTRLQKKLLRYMKQHRIAFGPVFVTRSGAPLDRSNIWREMKALCRAAGVSDKKVFPHNFRHLFARTFYRLNKDLAKLADLLGHSSINTTRIYIRTTSAEHRRCLERMRLVL